MPTATVAQVARTTGAAAVLAFVTLVAATPASAQGVASGRYVCMFSGKLAYDFTIQAGGRYTGSDAKPGSYSVAGGLITFRGGSLGGRRGRLRTGPPPSIAMLGKGGGEGETCELAR